MRFEIPYEGCSDRALVELTAEDVRVIRQTVNCCGEGTALALLSSMLDAAEERMEREEPGGAR